MRKMKTILIAASLSILFIVLGCKKKIISPDDGSNKTPLDGRGGGIIAYCYQPMTGNFNHQIYAMNADGTANQKMIDAPIGLNHHDWSPDGLQLVAVGYVSAETWSIYVFHADGTNLSRLTTTNNVWDTEPVWSPDGTQIVFTRIYPNQNERIEIWIMNGDGSNPYYIGVEGFAAKWSVDGARFIYQSSLRGSSDLFTCNVDGSDVQQLTDTAFTEESPVYSPDGTQIAYTTDRDGNHEIYLMNTDGTNPQRLTNHEYDHHNPRWSPDGSMIVFSSGPAQEWEVFIIDIDGTNMRQVTNSPTNITAINPVWKLVQ